MTDQDKWLSSKVRPFQSCDCPRREQKATLSTSFNSLIAVAFLSLLHEKQETEFSAGVIHFLHTLAGVRVCALNLINGPQTYQMRLLGPAAEIQGSIELHA